MSEITNIVDGRDFHSDPAKLGTRWGIKIDGESEDAFPISIQIANHPPTTHTRLNERIFAR